jgi:hypothetical protein
MFCRRVSERPRATGWLIYAVNPPARTELGAASLQIRRSVA